MFTLKMVDLVYQRSPVPGGPETGRAVTRVSRGQRQTQAANAAFAVCHTRFPMTDPRYRVDR